MSFMKKIWLGFLAFCTTFKNYIQFQQTITIHVYKAQTLIDYIYIVYIIYMLPLYTNNILQVLL